MKNVSIKKGIVVAFGELFLKSEGVRRLFKKTLIYNIIFFLKKANLEFKFFPFRERIFIETKETKKALKIIKNIFGLSWFADGFFFERAGIKEFSDFAAKNYQNWIKEKETFALRLKNNLKESREKIIKEIAKGIKRKVNLSKPKREIFIEAKKEGWFLYFKKRRGLGGLPVGRGGMVLTLISGGIDSPVASFLTAKRGAENIWLHFHSFPLVSRASIEKVKELAQIFLNYQPRLKIYFLPFAKAQMEIKTKTPAKYRILLYRRLMLKIAEIIAMKENCEAVVTGESLGQVSSQTLPNLRIIEDGIKIPVFRPLIGMDKEEIIDLAKKLKTFLISIKPQEDCCILFTPKHPTAKGKLEIIKKLEKELKIREMVKGTIKKAEIYD
jgi:thiamine biosynthesis protein ThiI